MSSQERTDASRGMKRFQDSLHIGMGVFYIIIGLLLLYVKHFGTIELSPAVAYGLGAITLLYGTFRIWRGIAGFKRKPQGR